MSRLFNDGATDRLYIDQAVLSATPLAMACNFNSNDTSIFHAIMCIADKDNANDMFVIRLLTAGLAQKVSVIAWHNPTTNAAVTSTGYTINTWHHACGIWATPTDSRSFIDGGSKGTDATNVTPVNLDRTSIGAEARSISYFPVSGMLAEVAIWDLSVWPGATDVLKADGFERIVASLAKGYTPDHFPLGLVAYWPLIRTINDKVGGYSLTASGTTVSNHPRVILPHGVQ